jgi:hypothetical protein
LEDIFMTIMLKKSPRFAPGAQVADVLRDSMRVVRSDLIPAPTTTPAVVTVCKVPANTVIMGVMLEVVAALVSTGALTLTLGDTGAAAAIASFTSGNLSSIGFVSSFGGKNYTADKNINATITNASAAGGVGSLRLWLLYGTESEQQSVG